MGESYEMKMETGQKPSYKLSLGCSGQKFAFYPHCNYCKKE